MILKFLKSKFSGYLSIALIVALLVSHAYVYSRGYNKCNNDQAIKGGKAAQKQVINEVSISEELRSNNKEVDQDEGIDIDIIRNAINRL